MGSEIRTEFLVLRKIPYADTSLVVAGITPDQGQVHFIVRGGRRITKTASPRVDLFRVMEVVYCEGKTDLRNWRQADVISDYGGLAKDLNLYQSAGWLARFALLNTSEGVETKQFFAAMCVALAEMAAAARRGIFEEALADAARCSVCLVYLGENGLLPLYEHDGATAGRIRLLLDAALGKRKKPSLPPGKWRELLDWTIDLLINSECRLP